MVEHCFSVIIELKFACKSEKGQLHDHHSNGQSNDNEQRWVKVEKVMFVEENSSINNEFFLRFVQF